MNPEPWQPYPKTRPSTLFLGEDREYEVQNKFGDVARCIFVRGRGFVTTNDVVVNGAGFALRASEISGWRLAAES